MLAAMTTQKRWLSLAALFAAAALGCGKSPEFAPEPYNDGGIDAAPLPPPPPATADTALPVQAGPCDPVQTLAMTTTLQGRAAAEAPGMQPEGAPICGIVPEGQTVQSPTFLLQQGFCYTFLGQSLPPVTEVDMELILDLSGGAQLSPGLAAMAQRPLLVDTETGEKAAMGAKQNCYVWPWPIAGQAKLVVKSRAGAGPVAAQAYKKKKP
jgi:hypothetical protein